MASRNHTPIDELRQREHLTPAECARVFGHGRNFWIEVFDQGRVSGHRAGGRRSPATGKVVGCRYIETESARAYLKSLSKGSTPQRRQSASAIACVRDFHRKYGGHAAQ